MTYLASAIVAVAALVILTISMRIVMNMELENRMAEAEIASSRLFQSMMGDRVEQVRRCRHDADALLRAIERSAEFGAGRFPLSNSAIELQRRRCRQAGIPFTAELEDVSESLIARGIDDSDLCLVLQNLMDNAYEASMAIGQDSNSPAERAISLRVGNSPVGEIAIAVENHTAEDTLPSFQTGKENPEYHGVGLRVVDDIARKYGGSLVAGFDAATRTLTMTVRLQPERSHGDSR